MGSREAGDLERLQDETDRPGRGDAHVELSRADFMWDEGDLQGAHFRAFDVGGAEPRRCRDPRQVLGSQPGDGTATADVRDSHGFPERRGQADRQPDHRAAALRTVDLDEILHRDRPQFPEISVEDQAGDELTDGPKFSYDASSREAKEAVAMDLGLKGKKALVAAASKGLGKAAALALAREGADVAICARNGDHLSATAEEIRGETGVEVLAVPADLARAADLERLIEATLGRFGRVDILFTNSGGRPPGLFWELSDDDWRQAVEGTLMAAVRLIRGVLPSMRERKWGRIICSSSIAAKQPLDNLILSNAVFAAVHGLAKTLANNLATEGITVNCINPGPILTDRIRELSRAQAEREKISLEEALASWGQATRMKRAGEPMEFGEAVAFLASERASFITGTSLSVDGGAHAGLL